MRIALLMVIFCGASMLSAQAIAQAAASRPSQSVAAKIPQTAAPAIPDPAVLLANASYAISFANGHLSGVGAAHLLHEVAGAQFVLLGESHYDHDTPLFAGALYRELNEMGFHHLVVEQDPIGIQDSQVSGVRGNASTIAEIAKRDPYLLGFASDQDLQLLADVGRLEKGPEPIWGLEQAQGTTRDLSELAKLAAAAELRAECENLLVAAREIEGSRGAHGNYLSDNANAYAQMKALREHFNAAAGSRERKLLDGLVKSAEIYSYYRRAEAGEYVGLFNNTVREALFKQEFVQDYHSAVAHGEVLPKAMFKFGDEHMYHGLAPLMAFPIGNFAHEFAISNGLDAYSINVVPLGAYAKWSDLPSWMSPLLPAAAPTHEVLIDLRALRPFQKLFRAKVAEADQWQFRAFINGYEALVLLPNSRKADTALTRFPNPF